ncbi:MAG: hypothetical protein IJ529_05485 [Alphaproteobacteria bacterium]|nr:hypothetical protein [Alphaproteobacteria bacterium]MBQ8677901.1 hypothetical protein [Alphaproteobacteria bacterium]
MTHLEKDLVGLYEDKVAAIPSDFEGPKENYVVPAIERERFKKFIQKEFPQLRYRNIEGILTIAQFAQKIANEAFSRHEFFDKALETIRETVHHPEYDFESVLLAEHKPVHLSGSQSLSEQANYFVKCQKVYNALSERMYTKEKFYPKSTALENAGNLRQLIEIYYRKGRF